MTTHRTLRQPVHLILDWDGTLTVKDTMALLGELPKARDSRLQHATPEGIEHGHGASHIANAIKHKLHGSAHHSDGQLSVTPTAGLKWDDFRSAYLKDYQAHKYSHYPLSDHVDPEEYTAWLESFRSVEYGSAQRVIDAGFFRAVRTEDVAKVARDALDAGTLQLRKGWLALFEMFLPHHDTHGPPLGSRISIMSVNWSEAFIRWSLYLAASRLTHLAPPRKMALLDYINEMEINSNHIHGLDSPQGSSGMLTGQIRTAQDKVAHMPGGRSAPHHSQSGGTADKNDTLLVVYVGDSSTDYQCLRRADVGIWVCDCSQSEYNPRFAETFKPLNVRHYTPSPVTEMREVDACTWCRWASNLEVVADFLEGLKEGVHWSGSGRMFRQVRRADSMSAEAGEEVRKRFG